MVINGLQYLTRSAPHEEEVRLSDLPSQSVAGLWTYVVHVIPDYERCMCHLTGREVVREEGQGDKD
jgi:hypothetical protein